MPAPIRAKPPRPPRPGAGVVGPAPSPTTSAPTAWSATQTTRRSSTPPASAPAHLKAAAASIEANGGAVKWFTSKVTDQDRPQAFFAVRRWPSRADPDSPVFQLRTEPTRAYLASLSAHGAPIAFGAMPESLIGVQAIALDRRHPLGAAIAGAAGVNAEAAIVLQPNARALTAAHEFQHWQDFVEPAYEARLASVVKRVPGLTGDEASFLSSVIDELRGHNGEAVAAEAFARRELPIVNRAGVAEPGTAARYEGEKADIRNKFIGAYGRDLRRLLGRLRDEHPAALEALRRELKTLDLSDRPGAVLSFERFVPD